jgi:hypothetical protein
MSSHRQRAARNGRTVRDDEEDEVALVVLRGAARDQRRRRADHVRKVRGAVQANRVESLVVRLDDPLQSFDFRLRGSQP